MQKKPAKRLTVKQVVHRHIKNKNDIITDEDLENIKIETCIPAKIKRNISETTEDHPKDEGKDHPVITPWNVIKE